MATYFSTFITGFQDIIPEMLRSKIDDVKIEHTGDGVIIYSSSKSREEILDLCMFNNTFLLVKLFGSLKSANIDFMMNWSIEKPDFVKAINDFTRNQDLTFRIIASRANQTISIDPEVQENLENLVQTYTNARIDRSGADCEIWFLERTEGIGLIGIRISKHPGYQTVLEKGELRPELACILNHLSEPSDSDTFLDPFCGSGAIPIHRARSYPYTKIIAADKDTALIENKARGFENFEILSADATDLEEISDNSVDKIVTDPPWGIFEKIENPKEFYEKFLNEFARVLKPDGIVVILTAQKELVDKTLADEKIKFKTENSWDILVSGKKARVYKFKKT